MKEQNIIYGLYEPESLGAELRYIGQSAIGVKRAYQHKKKSNLIAKTHKVNWIKSFISKNLMYEVKIILDLGSFSCNKERDTKLNEEEIRLIAYYKSLGYNLTNSTEGGEGTRGNILSIESKKLIGEKQKQHIQKNGLSEAFKKLIQPKAKQVIDGKEYKHCSDCNSYRPLSEYHKSSQSYDQLKSICKQCALNRDKKYKEGRKLNKADLEKSYENRKEAISSGIKAKYSSDPEYRKKKRGFAMVILVLQLNQVNHIKVITGNLKITSKYY